MDFQSEADRCLDFLLYSTQTVTGSQSRQLYLWNIASCARVWITRQRSSWKTRSAVSVGYSSDGCYIVPGDTDKKVIVWDAATGYELTKLKGNASLVSSVTFSPDGTYVASASNDLTIKLWNWKTGIIVRTFVGFQAASEFSQVLITTAQCDHCDHKCQIFCK